MGLRDLFGMSTKHTGQHQATPKHATGKHTASAKAPKPPRVPKSKKDK
jgi:hypothetical protein